MVKLIKVEHSGNIESIGYARKELYIRFHGHPMKTYRYWPVPKLFWTALQKASSKGTFFSEWIKGNFDYEVVDDTTSTPRGKNLVTGQ
jgi:hypothetical protein